MQFPVIYLDLASSHFYPVCVSVDLFEFPWLECNHHYFVASTPFVSHPLFRGFLVFGERITLNVLLSKRYCSFKVKKNNPKLTINSKLIRLRELFKFLRICHLFEKRKRIIIGMNITEKNCFSFHIIKSSGTLLYSKSKQSF